MAQNACMTQGLSVSTPVGVLTLSGDDTAITGLRWGGEQISDLAALREGARQIAAYFDGRLTRFDLPLRVEASAFQQSVCAAMQTIPMGETRTYGDLARDLGCSAQAVGRGCGGNPIPVIIPCHRVMGAGGRLVGFSGAGGVETKVALLRHEQAGGFLI